MRTFFLVVGMGLLFVVHAFAADLEVSGQGKVAITEDVQTVANSARALALRNAVIEGVNRIIGAGAAEKPEVKEKLDSLAGQVDTFKINESATPQRINSDYVLTIKLTLDEKKFRKLLSDQGLAANTSTARSSAIIMMMDEFFTKPSDINAPLEELTEFKKESGSHNTDSATAQASKKEAAAIDAASTHATEIEGRTVKGSDSGATRVVAAASHESSSSSTKNSDHEKHDNRYYKKLVRYQPRNVGPEKQNYTLKALAGIFEDYDLKIVNNDMFRSKYFGDKPITLDKLQSGKELAKYATFAKKEANVDFFSIGSTVVIDTGKSNDTGTMTCNGLVSVAVYSTNDGEEIASESLSESASGDSSDQCRANVASKLADVAGKTVAVRVQEFWKRRNMYGREYMVTYVGKLPLMARVAFMNAVKKAQGVDKAVQRTSSDKEYQLVVTYKGESPIDQAIAMELSTNPTFANLDSQVDGTLVKLCPGSCGTGPSHKGNRPEPATTVTGRIPASSKHGK